MACAGRVCGKAASGAQRRPVLQVMPACDKTDLVVAGMR